MKHLAENLIILRENLGLTQVQLAEKIGSKRGAVAQWELGSNYPREIKITKLAKLANVTPEEFKNSPLRLYNTIKFSPNTKIQLKVPGDGKIFKRGLDGKENPLDSSRTKHLLIGGGLNMSSVISMTITDLLQLQKLQTDPETIQALQEIISYKKDCEFLKREIDMLMARLADKDQAISAKNETISAKDETIRNIQQVRK